MDGIDIDDDHYNFKFLSPFVIYYYIIDAHGDTRTIGWLTIIRGLNSDFEGYGY